MNTCVNIRHYADASLADSHLSSKFLERYSAEKEKIDDFNFEKFKIAIDSIPF